MTNIEAKSINTNRYNVYVTCVKGDTCWTMNTDAQWKLSEFRQRKTEGITKNRFKKNNNAKIITFYSDKSGWIYCKTK